MGTLLNGIKALFSTSQSSATHVPTCQSDGTPVGRISVGDLASVLGEQLTILMDADLDTIVLNHMGQKTYRVGTNCTHKPIETDDGYMLVYGWSEQTYTTQVYFDPNNDTIYIRSNRVSGRVAFEPWSELLPNVPHFYKDYNNLASLATALGVGVVLQNIANGNSYSREVGDTALCLVKRDTGDTACVFIKAWSYITIIGGDNIFTTDTSASGKVVITAAQRTLTITNKADSSNHRLLYLTSGY